MKNICILGSTGSIGTQTLEVVSNNNDMNVVAIACNNNIGLLEKQVRKFKPQYVAIYDSNKANDFRENVKDLEITVYSGIEGLELLATLDCVDIVVTAVVGMIGLRPTIAAIKASKIIALANKETLVAAGHIIMPLALKYKTTILPVDSEHSAIFQCLNGENKSEIDKILLTASGGAFLKYSKEELDNVTLGDALKHPNWVMGPKVTIDSSTLGNKGLEVIEAKWLFDVDPKDIEVVIQPQSIIHSMVQFNDGAVIAQLGTPDMKTPIQYALTYPNRVNINVERLDFSKVSKLEFLKPDFDRFPLLKCAYDAITVGGSMPLIFNLYNEIAVSKFMKEEIKYLEIPQIVIDGMTKHKLVKNPDLDTILLIENEIRNKFKS